MKSLRWPALLGLMLALIASVVQAPASSALADDGARIDSPAPGAQVSGKVEIRGVATTGDPSTFSFYRLYYGSGASPSVFRPIGPPGDQPVDGGALGLWDTTTLLLGDYTVLLMVYDTSGKTTTASVVVSVIPGPTPTPLTNLAPAIFPTPSVEATPPEEQIEQPAPTPLPELPQLVPEIPSFNEPPPAEPNPPPIPEPNQTNNPPNLAPIPQSPIGPPAPQLPNPAPPPPTIESGTNVAPPPPAINPVAPVAPPPAPVIPPYEPPPPPPTIAPPTPFGLPP
ncbi:MAG: hypothetical protein IT305_11065 [Chloroflexi bacterium]|nr:hypothetical protein [Chloroflexota bacterium]